MNKQQEFEKSIKNNDLIIIKELLKNPRVDPSVCANYASNNNHSEVVRVLLNDERVYDLLKSEDNELYKKSFIFIKQNKRYN